MTTTAAYPADFLHTDPKKATAAVRAWLPEAVAEVPGFMPIEEGLALFDAVVDLPGQATVVEIGSYACRSTVFLAAAAMLSARPPQVPKHIVTVDHHRGSEEHQPGWEYHDESFVSDDGRFDTAGAARATLADTGLEAYVSLVVSDSLQVARWWRYPIDAVFLDGSHTYPSAWADFDAWLPWVRPGGLLLIHDVFDNPRDGGQAPRTIRDAALATGWFAVATTHGSLQILRRRQPDSER